MTPYLNFDGQCAAAFRFYEQLLSGRLEAARFGMVIDRFGTPWMINGGEDSPPTDAQESPETARSAGR